VARGNVFEVFEVGRPNTTASHSGPL
jgi:hypothetical protein